MADTVAFRKRLEKLARSAWRTSGEIEGPERPKPEAAGTEAGRATVVYRRDLPRRKRGGPGAGGGNGFVRETPRLDLRPDLRPALRLEEAVEGEVVSGPRGGTLYLVTSFVPGSAPEGDLFFDIESTGLTSTPLFLIGAMSAEDRGLKIVQYLARDYSEEAAAIDLFLTDAARFARLVSFNGKSYDLPYIRTRAAATGVPFDLDLPHQDLLHASRRAFKDELPNCRLQTLETLILGKPREPDIPGAEIPEAYHSFVHTGDATKIATIIRHNRADLVTLAELQARLPAEGEDAASTAPGPPDAGSRGRERRGCSSRRRDPLPDPRGPPA